MADYKLSLLAEADIKEISVTTIEVWGKQQARLYIESLHNSLLTLAQHPDLGRVRDEVFSGAKSFPSGRHIIFYKPRQGGIDVARVLHQRMDLLSQFDN